MLEIILIAVGGALVLISAVYGALRRFSRMTWIGWQLLIAFGIIFGLGQIDWSGKVGELGTFIIALAEFTVAAVVPLILEYVGRRLLVTDRILKPGTGEMVFDRIFGAVTAIVTTLSFFLVVGAFGISLTETMMGKSLFSMEIYAVIWTGFFKKYALDLFIVALYLIIIRAGCRLGILNGLRVLIVFLLVAGGFFGSFLLATRVGFGISFSQWVGGLFSGLPRMLGAMIGAVIVTFLFTAICFVIAMVLNKLMDMGIRKLRGVTAVGIIDSILTGVLFGAIFLVVMVGLYTGYHALGNMDIDAMVNSLLGSMGDLFSSMGVENLGDSLGEVGKILSDFTDTLVKFVTSSPLSGMVYNMNPLLGLI